ncbi:hypothetical protein BY458DRAFT_516119 [Sporodiniella umbellata]|nr:hypothetical protein BY458DRAFT_516110 [Sporodiniella umbellata]KAI9261043.1 hypothetical protein BY458DRAFT_516119 [Sporodiniella umbellata]
MSTMNFTVVFMQFLVSQLQAIRYNIEQCASKIVIAGVFNISFKEESSKKAAFMNSLHEMDCKAICPMQSSGLLKKVL